MHVCSEGASTKVYVFPADGQMCGHLRLIWPAEILRARGHDVTVVPQNQRQLLVQMDEAGEVTHVGYPADADVMVFQRITHRHLVKVVRFLRSVGVATVVDIDDDLSAIHPANPAWEALHPRSSSEHSWNFLVAACREASMVVTSSPALLPRYAAHGRGRVIYNYLPEHYYGLERQDSDVLGWPASLHSHPDDPGVTRGAVGRLVAEGARFRAFGDTAGVGRAFGLPEDPPAEGFVELADWPKAVASIGVGIAPLADTRFSQAKSWLKPLEMCATGVPWVASPRPEYERLHRMGAGLLAKKGPDWYRSLRRLRESPAMRDELSGQGREVADRLRLELHVEEHLAAWTDALAVQRGATRVS